MLHRPGKGAADAHDSVLGRPVGGVDGRGAPGAGERAPHDVDHGDGESDDDQARGQAHEEVVIEQGADEQSDQADAEDDGGDPGGQGHLANGGEGLHDCSPNSCGPRRGIEARRHVSRFLDMKSVLDIDELVKLAWQRGGSSSRRAAGEPPASHPLAPRSVVSFTEIGSVPCRDRFGSGSSSVGVSWLCGEVVREGVCGGWWLAVGRVVRFVVGRGG